VDLPEFAQPWWLLLALLVPPLLWWWHNGRRPALRFSDTVILRALPRGRSRGAVWGGLGLRGAALLLLIVALAGPRWPDPGTRIPTEGIAILLVVDVSGSMAERDFSWQGEPVRRLDAVKKVLEKFIEGGEAGGERFEGRRNDLVGLVTFATVPESVCPLTLSHGAVLKLLEAEQPRILPQEGMTNIGDAVAWGLHRLKAAGNRRKVLILLTDGEQTVKDKKVLRPLQAAQLAGNLGVPIYTIDAGSDAPPKGLDADETSVANRLEAKEVLQKVARMTKGHYFQAGDTKGLLEVCGQIDRLERHPIESFQYRRYAEAYPWVGLAAFVLLLGLQVLELTRWRRMP
jgi:Ca-activated chloride channel family protein